MPESKEVELDMDKTIPENASNYYDKVKKAKAKFKGLKEAILSTEKKIKEAKKKQVFEEKEKKPVKKVQRKQDWYEKFHWTFSSDGFLIIGGRDMKSNQQVVKKHMQSNDLYFHADITGAPSVILISGGIEIPDTTKQEAARFAAIYSKAFSLGVSNVDVYSVRPEQVMTAAKAGEFLPKGGFQLRGKREWFKAPEMAIDISYDAEKNRPFAGFNLTGNRVRVIPGHDSKGDSAKRLKSFLEKDFNTKVDINELLRLLPPGDCFVSEFK